MTTTLTAEELAEIEARTNAATPGPWAYESVSQKSNDYRVGIACPVNKSGDPEDQISGNMKNHPHYFDVENNKFGEWYCEEVAALDECSHSPDGAPAYDAAFIAHARTDIPALLASHKAQAAEIERLTREVEKEEKAHEITIDQRDAAEEALGNAYTIITGQVPEWSNLFDYNAALLEIEEAAARAIAAEAKVAALTEALNTPEVFDFVKAVQMEAAHQRERWGAEHDAGKTDADWFWLVGYLAGKALHNPANDMPPHEAQLHRIVATAAALANWHLAKLGLTNMRPGIEPPTDTALGAKP